jgi:hypothetical protein
MSLTRTAAEREEEAELNDLRDQADRSTAEAAQILAELTRRITVVRRPGQAARRLTADVRVAALRALREGPGGIVGRRGAWRPVLAAIPVLTLAAALAYAAARGKLIPPKIKFSAPERIRLPARRPIPRNR